MIQDIKPHHFYNQYEPKTPLPNDHVLLYQKGLIFMQEQGAVPYVKDLHSSDWRQLQYLFSIDEKAYFTLLQKPLCLPSGYAFHPIRSLRGLPHAAEKMAGASGYQLWSWYRSRQFCGSCGNRLQHDQKERMLYCDHCGAMEYPKICPAVIVAIVDGDEMVLTRYAGRSYQKDALIAGFCEIGETLEDTVRREVMEEVGLRVKNIRYYKSQPWSFTDTLLSGFFCEIDGSRKIVLDERELAQARWVKREDIPEDEEHVSLTAEMMTYFKRHGAF